MYARYFWRHNRGAGQHDGRASKRSLIVRFTVTGRVPSGAERWGKVLDAVSTAILGGCAAGNRFASQFSHSARRMRKL